MVVTGVSVNMDKREEQNGDELAQSLWERFTAQETLLSLDGLEIKTNAFEFNKEWSISWKYPDNVEIFVFEEDIIKKT